MVVTEKIFDLAKKHNGVSRSWKFVDLSWNAPQAFLCIGVDENTLSSTSYSRIALVRVRGLVSPVPLVSVELHLLGLGG